MLVHQVKSENEVLFGSNRHGSKDDDDQNNNNNDAQKKKVKSDKRFLGLACCSWKRDQCKREKVDFLRIGLHFVAAEEAVALGR